MSLAALGPAVTAQAAVQAPTIVISYNSGPGGDLSDGDQFSQATIGNVVPLSVGADTSDASYPTKVQLAFDGAVVSSTTCTVLTPPNPFGAYCTTGYDFVPGQVSAGTHTFQAQATTSTGLVVSTPLIHVQVIADPDPLTVTISSPSDGATVSGEAAVTATGTVTAASGDAGQSMQLFSYAGPLGEPVPCPSGSPLQCTVTLHWDTSTVPNGPYSLYVAFSTKLGAAGGSSVINVTLANAVTTKSIVTLAPGGTYPVGAYGEVHGTVVNAATGKPVVGSLVTVSYTPYSGQAFSETEFTDVNGNFSALDPINLTSNTAVSANTGPYGLNTPAVTSWKVTVPISCHVPGSVTHGTMVAITCHADYLADHSVLALRITGGSIPHATLFAKIDSHGNATFTQTFAHAHQTLTVRATTATTHTYSASSSPTYPLTVS